MWNPKLPWKHARRILYAQILTGYFCALRNRKCLSFESANPYRCVSRTRVAWGRAHAQCNDANCGRSETKVFARAICGRRGSRGSGFQLRVFNGWQTRARVFLSTWPVAHSKFGSWAVNASPVMKHSQRTANCPSHLTVQELKCFQPFAYISLLLPPLPARPSLYPSPHPPRKLTFSFFLSPYADGIASPTRTPRHFAATGTISYAIIGSRCGEIRSRWEGDWDFTRVFFFKLGEPWESRSRQSTMRNDIVSLLTIGSSLLCCDHRSLFPYTWNENKPYRGLCAIRPSRPNDSPRTVNPFCVKVVF